MLEAPAASVAGPFGPAPCRKSRSGVLASVQLGAVRLVQVPFPHCPGFGPNAGQCGNGTWTSLTAPSCTDASTPLLLFLQGAGPNGPATDAAGASSIKNEDYALFAQDKWQVRSNFTLSY